MEPLECLKDYFGRFHPFSFNEFSEIYNLLYSDYENLQNRIEFSLLIDKDNEIDLRFGLFKLYDTQRISSLFRKKWYEIPDLERILNLAKALPQSLPWDLISRKPSKN